MLYLWTHAWQYIKTYNDEEYEVDEVVEGMSVHDVVHDLHPALQRDHLHKPDQTTIKLFMHLVKICLRWSITSLEGRVSNFVTIYKMYNFIRFRSIKRTTTSLIKTSLLMNSSAILMKCIHTHIHTYLHKHNKININVSIALFWISLLL